MISKVIELTLVLGGIKFGYCIQLLNGHMWATLLAK